MEKSRECFLSVDDEPGSICVKNNRSEGNLFECTPRASFISDFTSESRATDHSSASCQLGSSGSGLKWITQYKNSIKNIEDLSKFMPFADDEKNKLKQVEEIYPMRITNYYLSLIKDFSDGNDPVRKQCVPSFDELTQGSNEEIDPLTEVAMSPVPCLVHRYPDRVLLIVTGRCFMYCRHCTRKRLWGKDKVDPSLDDIKAALDYIKANKQIREVIISGGDPLILSTERLDYILSLVASIDNIEVIRIGSRAPVVIPQRVDRNLCVILKKYSNLWINVQFNHVNEITKESADACAKLIRCGIPVSNQSVLLKGVNDSPQSMIKLCRKLQSIRVRPYYLFQCDQVVGTNHFRTPVSRGIEIIKEMRGYTSGMCVPTFIVDGVKGKGKVPLQPNYLVSLTPRGAVLRSYTDEVFEYKS
ncbi:MAG: KamA family radical SAM protein [Candidatus Omnitrophota bacterium]|nr:KamA family radical SAM protein [Candidatus Omnitrophota bacterium]